MKKRARDRDGAGAGAGGPEKSRQLRRKTIVSAQNRNRCERLVEYSSHEPLHDHGILVVTLGFLADAESPSELLEISKSSRSFRAAALDNIIWKEMCDKKWKTKFGYRFRMERAANDDERKNGDDISKFARSVSSSSLRPYPTAASDDIDCPKAGFWYHRDWNELRMSTVNRITLSDLTEPRWSIATWFLPPNPKLLPTYWAHTTKEKWFTLRSRWQLYRTCRKHGCTNKGFLRTARRWDHRQYRLAGNQKPSR